MWPLSTPLEKAVGTDVALVQFGLVLQTFSSPPGFHRLLFVPLSSLTRKPEAWETLPPSQRYWPAFIYPPSQPLVGRRLQQLLID